MKLGDRVFLFLLWLFSPSPLHDPRDYRWFALAAKQRQRRVALGLLGQCQQRLISEIQSGNECPDLVESSKVLLDDYLDQDLVICSMLMGRPLTRNQIASEMAHGSLPVAEGTSHLIYSTRYTTDTVMPTKYIVYPKKYLIN